LTPVSSFKFNPKEKKKKKKALSEGQDFVDARFST
jgi:hypothetical protein